MLAIVFFKKNIKFVSRARNLCKCARNMREKCEKTLTTNKFLENRWNIKNWKYRGDFIKCDYSFAIYFKNATKFVLKSPKCLYYREMAN